MKLKVAVMFKRCYVRDFADKLLLFHFNRTKMFNLCVFNTVYECALYSAFQLQMQEIDR